MTITLPWRPSPRTLISTGISVLGVLLAMGGLWFWYSGQQDRAQIVHAEALARAA